MRNERNSELFRIQFASTFANYSRMATIVLAALLEDPPLTLRICSPRVDNHSKTDHHDERGIEENVLFGEEPGHFLMSSHLLRQPR